jgi:GH15 family glucan-1,4-alpha-glucosidase
VVHRSRISSGLGCTPPGRPPAGASATSGTLAENHRFQRETAFLPCSSWLAQALARTGRRDDAAALLDELVALGGPLGLFAEEMDPTTREHLGNYPQALTQAALVQAVLALADTTVR